VCVGGSGAHPRRPCQPRPRAPHRPRPPQPPRPAPSSRRPRPRRGGGRGSHGGAWSPTRAPRAATPPAAAARPATPLAPPLSPAAARSKNPACRNGRRMGGAPGAARGSAQRSRKRRCRGVFRVEASIREAHRAVGARVGRQRLLQRRHDRRGEGLGPCRERKKGPWMTTAAPRPRHWHHPAAHAQGTRRRSMTPRGADRLRRGDRRVGRLGREERALEPFWAQRGRHRALGRRSGAACGVR
jgi:hypothetical protein